jgi:hypothetical protein
LYITLNAATVSESSARAKQRRESADSMKKTPTKQANDELRPEYDLSKLKGGVRGKYYRRATAGTNLVLIDPDLSKLFPDSDSVNRALRRVAEEIKPRQKKAS